MFRVLITPKSLSPAELLPVLKESLRPWTTLEDPICGAAACLDYTGENKDWIFNSASPKSTMGKELMAISARMSKMDPGTRVIVAEFKEKEEFKKKWKEGGTRVEVLENGRSLYLENHYGNVINALGLLHADASPETMAQRYGSVWSVNQKQRWINEKSQITRTINKNKYASMAFYLKFINNEWPLDILSREEKAGLMYMSAVLDLISEKKIEKCFNEMGERLGMNNPSTALNLVFSFDVNDQIVSCLHLDELITSMMLQEVRPPASIQLDDLSFDL